MAVSDSCGVAQLCSFIFDFYAGEEDNEYVFESEKVRIVFDVLATYLEFVEAYGDPFLNQKLKRLKAVMEIECIPEFAVLAIYLESISVLIDKLNAGVISEIVFQRQLRKLTPINVNWQTVLKLYRSYSRMLNQNNR